MKDPVTATKLYVTEILGPFTLGQPWAEARKLPFFLQDHYQFHSAAILERPCLLMISRTSGSETPAVVQKHWKSVTSRYSGDVIYVVAAMTSSNRKRLIEQSVPFIVPGNQLYLPMWGMDLREHFKFASEAADTPLSAAAQVLLLRAALGRDDRSLPAKALAELLGYSAMTLTRAIKELVQRDLATAEMTGREKRLTFTLKAEKLWSAAQPYLQNPIKKRIWVAAADKTLPAKIAGESALANYTMLAEPRNKMMAINASEWPRMKKLLSLEQREEPDFDSTQLELWRYNPGLLTEEETVDPLSLNLSLENRKDERIEMALQQLLESVWSGAL